MKFRTIIYLFSLTVFFIACKREPIQLYEDSGLGITLEFPRTAITKADVYAPPTDANEVVVNDLILWAFVHDDNNPNTHTLIGSFEVSASELPEGGGTKRYVIPIVKGLKETLLAQGAKVDVFALANRGTIGLKEGTGALTESTEWADLNNAFFGGDAYFSSKEGHRNLIASDAGLPMSGVGLGLPVSGGDPTLSVASISLKRSVSKIRFLFSKMVTEGENAEIVNITGIKLNGNQIPVSEYVFCPSGTRIKTADGYEADDMLIKPTVKEDEENIYGCESPELYVYADGMSGSAYEAVIQEGLDNHKLSSFGTTYLRESDKQLSGVITYTVSQTKNGVTTTREGEKPFSMSVAGDFSRNHTWTVYGYFISDRTLQLSVSVLPWDMNRYTINFSEASLMVTQKLRVVPESVYSIEPIDGMKDHFNVKMFGNVSARAYLYVVTPENGWLQVLRVGDRDYFKITEEDNRIDPGTNRGRIDLSISLADDAPGNQSGKSITLQFKAFTNDWEREISGASECVDQVYHFILP